MDGTLRHRAGGGGVPPCEQAGALRVERPEFRQRTVRGAAHAVQQRTVGGDEPPGLALVELPVAVGEQAAQAVVVPTEPEHDVVLRGIRRHVHRRDAHARQFELRVGEGLEQEHGLEDRGAIPLPPRPRGLDDLVEGELPVGEGGVRLMPGRREEIPGGQTLVDPGTHRNKGEEETQGAFQLRVRPVRQGTAHHDVVGAGQSGQEQRVGREQHGVMSGARLGAQGVDAVQQLLVVAELQGRSAVSGGGCAPASRHQVERGGRVGERAAPELPLPFRSGPGQPLLLPVGEVGVLEREFRQLGVAARDPGTVQLGQFPLEDAGRPAVRDSVVLNDQEDPPPGSGADEVEPAQRGTGQVEGVSDEGTHQCVRLVRGAHVPVERYGAVRIHRLDQFPVRVGQRRTQDLVPGGQFPHRPAQGRDVQVAPQFHPEVHVVDGQPRGQLLAQPHLVLGPGGGDAAGAVGRHEGQRAFGVVTLLFPQEAQHGVAVGAQGLLQLVRQRLAGAGDGQPAVPGLQPYAEICEGAEYLGRGRHSSKLSVISAR
ncbi:hypothetical protein SBADM41S_12047 [Streptomyces badius]